MTNSLIALAINLVGMLVIYSLMANALTRFHWRGRGTLGVLGTIIAAGLFWMLPLFLINLKNIDPVPCSFWFANWLVSGFSVVVLSQRARWIPRELEDSARLDGCGYFGIFRHVVLPLVRREIGLIALLTLMATSMLCWTAFAFSGTDVVPPWIVQMMPLETGVGPSLTRMLLALTTGSLILTLPVMAIFFFAKHDLRTRSVGRGGRGPVQK
ncbi:MAG: hypothetical protein DMF06_11310 [Verrucomicrobia bacterium]|nr:MAG: hypothetical protein DMF06_11310 [Verrucomicrobiota bacterium]